MLVAIPQYRSGLTTSSTKTLKTFLRGRNPSVQIRAVRTTWATAPTTRSSFVAIPQYRSGQFGHNYTLPDATLNVDQKSQSLSTDQGSSDRDAGRIHPPIPRNVAIPQYRSGQFGHLYDLLAQDGAADKRRNPSVQIRAVRTYTNSLGKAAEPAQSQSLSTDQGSSDPSKAGSYPRLTISGRNPSVQIRAVRTPDANTELTAPADVAIPQYRSGQFGLNSGSRQAVYLEVAIPQYRSGQFGRHSNMRHQGKCPESSQSLSTDQGSSDAKGYGDFVTLTIESQSLSTDQGSSDGYAHA